jgi:serine/threonine protein kinase
MEAGGGRGLVGHQLGPYRLEAMVGAGAYGHVYRARHEVLEVLRAVKVMQAEIAGEAQFQDRFLREARMAARLTHPNIVPVYDSGLEGDIWYLVMEYVDSLTLREHLDRMPVEGRVGDPRLRRWIQDVASALDYAHALGTIHRDVKPANVLIRSGDGRALLTDFGVARAVTDTNLTMTGRSLGTYAYMSPEQCEGVADLTTQSDVYAFAALLYEVATGEPPFGRGVMAVAGHVNRPVPPARLAGPRLPDGIDAVLARGLMKLPRDRYATAGELATAFLVAAGTARATADSNVDGTVLDNRPADRWQPPQFAVLVEEAPVPATASVWRRLRPGSLPDRRSVLMVLAVAAAGALQVALAVFLAAGVLQVALAALHPPPPPRSQVLPAPVSGTVGSPVTLAGVQVTILAVDGNAQPRQPAPADSRLVSIQVSYRVTGRGPAIVSPYDWVLTDASGATYSAVEQGAAGDLPQSELPPGQEVRGAVAFVVPRQAQGLVVHFDPEVGNESAAIATGA